MVSAPKNGVVTVVVWDEGEEEEQIVAGLGTEQLDIKIEDTDQWLAETKGASPSETEGGLLEKARRLQEACGGFAGAEHLHKNITGERWGITADVLEDFEKRTKEKLDAKEIKNTGMVPYDQKKFDDHKIGPNMYQINEQVVMPVTKERSLPFPGVSWSLMADPLGALVTIFITHAWAEGVFEFWRNVRTKWPEGLAPSGLAHAAYICFLSNPQHLDISDMLKEIETSPFKVVLNLMPRPGLMIVSPNKECPIHSRLWCVAELFWATDQEIPIVVGGDAADLAEGSQHAAAARANEVAVSRHRDKCVQIIHNKEVRRSAVIGMGGALVFVAIILYNFVVNKADEATVEKMTTAEKGAQEMGNTMFFIAIVGYGVLFTLFLLRAIYRCVRAVREQQKAESGAFVDIKHAKCSYEADANRIWAAIAGQEDLLNKFLGRLVMYGVAYEKDVQSSL